MCKNTSLKKYCDIQRQRCPHLNQIKQPLCTICNVCSTLCLYVTVFVVHWSIIEECYTFCIINPTLLIYVFSTVEMYIFAVNAFIVFECIL